MSENQTPKKVLHLPLGEDISDFLLKDGDRSFCGSTTEVTDDEEDDT